MSFDLTNPGVVDPSTGQTTYGPLAKIGKLIASLSAKTAQPQPAVISGDVPPVDVPNSSPGRDLGGLPQSEPQPNGAHLQDAAFHPPVENVPPPPVPSTPNAFGPAPVGAQPSVVHPTFAQTSRDQFGNIAKINPAETKLGKLLHILGGGVQGGIDAVASGALDAVPHRSSIGAGVAGATEMPFQRAQRALASRTGTAEAALAEAGAQPVDTPYGRVPASLVPKFLTPLLGYQGKVEAANIGAGAKTQSAETAAGSRVEAAQIAKRFVPVPGVGLFDSSTRQVIPGTAQGITVTPEIQQDFGLPADFVGKPMTLQNLSSLEGAQARQVVPVQGAAGPSLVNKKTGKTQNLGLGSPGVAVVNARPVQVADPNNPGDLTYTAAGNAIANGSPAPGSAATKTAQATAKAVAPGGKVGDQITAFQTAIEHAKLLRQVATAINNGDVRTLNGLKNRFKQEFGSDDLNNLNIVTGAYSREITKMLSGGHFTDSEIGQNGATLPNNANVKTLIDAANNYQKLAESKMGVLQKNVKKGLHGKAGFDDEPTDTSKPYVPAGAVKIGPG